MYFIISCINVSADRVAGKLNSWFTKSSVLGVTPPLTLAVNDSQHLVVNYFPLINKLFFFVLPMIPPALFCNRLIVCSIHMSPPTEVNLLCVRFTTNLPALKFPYTVGASSDNFLISSRYTDPHLSLSCRIQRTGVNCLAAVQMKIPVALMVGSHEILQDTYHFYISIPEIESL